jgi:hypothetical protein
VDKERSQRFYLERFNLKMLNEVEARDKHRSKVSNTFAALDDFDAEVLSRLSPHIEEIFGDHQCEF